MGVNTLSDADILYSLSHPQLRPGLSCGILQLSSLRTSEFPKLPDTSPEIPMSEVKDQGVDHGFCTAYAVSAVIEAITGIKVSEAELMLRLKTSGGDDRTCDGSHLYLFPEIIREGVVLETNFPKTEEFKEYINIRKRMVKEGSLDTLQRFGNTQEYKKTIDEFIDWCKRSNRTIPSDLKPNWETETYEARVDDGTPLVGKVFINLHPATWIFRMFSDQPALWCETIESRTRFSMDVNSYYCVKFRMKRLAVFEPHHPSGDPFYKLKFTLVQRTPIAISVKTFAKYKLDADGKRVIEETWLGTAPKLENDYKIDLPTSKYERYGGHAICLCGYDNTKNAFRIKNSWSTNWADKGYAWLSYDYVAQHAFMDDAFSIEIDRR